MMYSSSPVVEGLTLKFWNGVPSFDQNVITYQVSCLLILQLLSYTPSRRKKHSNFCKMYYFFAKCGTQLSVTSLKVKTT